MLPISVIIPARNEAANIARVVRCYKQVAAQVVVFDDWSNDNTGSIAAQHGADVIGLPERTCHIPVPLGQPIGTIAAANAGLKYAKQPWVATVSANDGVLDVNTLYRLTEPLNCDVCPTYVAGRVQFCEGRKRWVSLEPHGAGALWNRRALGEGFREYLGSRADHHRLLELAHGRVLTPAIVQQFHVNRTSNYWIERESAEWRRQTQIYFRHDPVFGYWRRVLSRIRDDLPWWLFNPLARAVANATERRWRA
jgi:glycosyltransferase involved in cell wall biosynthesis